MDRNQKTRQAIYASILRDPKEASVLAAIGILHLLLAYFGFSGWPCPIWTATGIPCPGCGLTRGSIALLQGDLRGMAAAHIFAPVFLIGVVLTGIIAILPEAIRSRIIDRVERFELQTNLFLWILISLLMYWGLRLSLDPSCYIARMATTI